MSNHLNLASNPESIDTLAINLRNLIQSKSVSECELARRTNIPQPTIHKILTGKTTDPRASTLKALADFFEISIEELLTGSRYTQNNTKTQSVAILSWKECIEGVNFVKNLSTSNWKNWIVTEFISPYAYALISKSSMEPRFPKKTTLIIDPDIKAEDGDIIVVHYPNTDEATIRELSIDGPTQLLLPLNETGSVTEYEKDIKILGVLVKSSFSYFS
ncbi:MAG: helix-turn-helix domain-containing protein [Gammaproteobacteria bacterium]